MVRQMVGLDPLGHPAAHVHSPVNLFHHEDVENESDEHWSREARLIPDISTGNRGAIDGEHKESVEGAAAEVDVIFIFGLAMVLAVFLFPIESGRVIQPAVVGVLEPVSPEQPAAQASDPCKSTRSEE